MSGREKNWVNRVIAREIASRKVRFGAPAVRPGDPTRRIRAQLKKEHCMIGAVVCSAVDARLFGWLGVRILLTTLLFEKVHVLVILASILIKT